MQAQQALPVDEVNRDLVQTCVFGMGLLCLKMPAETFPLANVFSTIEWIYAQDFKTESGKRAECCENATSTFGKCIYFHGANLSADIAARGFFDRLPLTTDTEEAQPTHKMLMQQIIARNANLVRPELLTSLQNAVQRIKETSDSRPDLEILDDEGKALLA